MGGARSACAHPAIATQAACSPVSTFRRGHVYWVRMPGEAKKRPALVLSSDIRNDRSPTVVVVPCTRTLRFGPWHVELRKGEAGIPEACVAKCEDVTMLSKSDLVPGALGPSLSNARLLEVRDALLDALDFV